MNAVKKEVGSDLIDSFLKAQKAMKGYPIPDPSEIMSNKEKYLQEFTEYKQMVNQMKNDNTANILKLTSICFENN